MAVILLRDEEANIARAWTPPPVGRMKVVLDSSSTVWMLEIAHRYGCQVAQNLLIDAKYRELLAKHAPRLSE
jgi:hypothetical protein